MKPLRAPRLVDALVLLLGPVVGLAVLIAPASASSAVVSVQDFSFTPAVVTVGQGETVTWTFHALHTTTSNQGFWNSGARSTGSYAVAFPDAGTFGYHCSMHPSMTGRVRVPVQASGAPATGWRLRWSARTGTPADRRFDVQVKRAGASTWTWLRRATARRSAMFDPSRHGSYLVRARTHNGAVGRSGWSPALTVRIS
jgi:plastocyanin